MQRIHTPVYIHAEAHGRKRHAFKVNVPYNLNDRSIRAQKCQKKKKTIHKDPSIQQWQVVIKLNSSSFFPFPLPLRGEIQPSSDLGETESDKSTQLWPFSTLGRSGFFRVLHPTLCECYRATSIAQKCVVMPSLNWEL